MADWLSTRPPIIQEAAVLWPMSMRLSHEGEVVTLLGWTETRESEQSGDPHDLMLIFTPGDPWVDYEDAHRRKVYLCARHVPEVVCQMSSR